MVQLFKKQKPTKQSQPADELQAFLTSKGLPEHYMYKDCGAHNLILRNCIDRVKQTAEQLQEIDAKMLPAFAIGFIALAVPFLPFNWTLTIVGFSYGFYQYGLRNNASKEYNLALEELRMCCKWTLDNSRHGDIKLQDRLNSSEVKNVLSTLAPLMSTDELDNVLQEASNQTMLRQTYDIDFNQDPHTFEYKMYGYKQGGILDILVGVGYALQNMFNSLLKTGTDRQPTPRYN